jgi:hypothetical protein
MRVIFDGHHIGRHQTGNETYARGLAGALGARDDIDLTVAVDRGRSGDVQGLPISSIRELPRNAFGRLASLPILARQRHADLIHTIYYRPLGPAGRSVVSVHDVSYERFPEFFSRVERLKNRILVGDAIRRASAICTLTNHAKSEIVDIYRVDPDRVFVVPCGVAPVFLEAAAQPRR